MNNFMIGVWGMFVFLFEYICNILEKMKEVFIIILSFLELHNKYKKTLQHIIVTNVFFEFMGYLREKMFFESNLIIKRHIIPNTTHFFLLLSYYIFWKQEKEL